MTSEIIEILTPNILSINSMTLLRSPLYTGGRVGNLDFRSHIPNFRPKPRGSILFLPDRSRVVYLHGGVERDVRGRSADVATLGNLCVDVVLSVPTLPPVDKKERMEYMEKLAASPPNKKYWEAGGNCNLAIAAARIGLHCVALGHVGDDIYGHFLQDVLYEEGIGMVSMNEDPDSSQLYNAFYQTLLCWVLVDPFQRHGFCSAGDFSKEPAFSWMTKLSKPVKKTIEQSKILFCNGYVFDELFPKLIISALDCALDSGTAVFFDPGPRGWTLSNGDPEQQRAIMRFLKCSDVLLFTSEEAEALTGIGNPIQAGQELLISGVRVKWVIIKMGSKGSISITNSGISGAPGFKVRVLDTVGCGDSFTAAIAFGFLSKMHAVNAIILANSVGAATATGCGAGRNVATLEKIIQLLRFPTLNDDAESWKSLIEEHYEKEVIVLVSKYIVNGIAGSIVYVSIDEVVLELLPQLEATSERRRMCHVER